MPQEIGDVAQKVMLRTLMSRYLHGHFIHKLRKCFENPFSMFVARSMSRVITEILSVS